MRVFGRSRRVATAGRSAAVAGFAALLCAPVAASAGEPPAEKQSLSYGAGYAFGEQLAELRRRSAGIELEAVLRGMLDALAGADAAPRGDAPQAAAPARRRGFVDDFAALNAQRPGVVVLPSGVQYEVLKAGSGRRTDPGGAVRVSYQGSLGDGEVFDSTYGDGAPVRLRIDEIVVPGLREALLRMREGDRWRVVVPPAMGFGRAGNNMLRKRDLIYELELVAVEPAP